MYLEKYLIGSAYGRMQISRGGVTIFANIAVIINCKPIAKLNWQSIDIYFKITTIKLFNVGFISVYRKNGDFNIFLDTLGFILNCLDNFNIPKIITGVSGDSWHSLISGSKWNLKCVPQNHSKRVTYRYTTEEGLFSINQYLCSRNCDFISDTFYYVNEIFNIFVNQGMEAIELNRPVKISNDLTKHLKYIREWLC